MESKNAYINATIRHFLQVAGKYARIEELPIRVDAQHTVSTREAHMIEAVGESDDMNVTMLASRFGISRSAASQMLAKLEKKGFVKKALAPHSAKEYQVSLTKLGRMAYEAHDRFHGKDKQALVERLGTFSLSQIATLSVLLEALGNVMDERLSSGKK